MSNPKSSFQKIGRSRFLRGIILQIIPLRHGVELILSTGRSLHIHRLSPKEFDPDKLATLIEMGTDLPKLYVTEHHCPDMQPNFFPPPRPKKKGGDKPGEDDDSTDGGGSPKPVKPTPTTPSAPPIESLKGPSWMYPPTVSGSSSDDGSGRGGRSR